MKVIISGAGISGLITYLSLSKHLAPSLPDSEPLTITIYEKHASSDSSPAEGHLIGGFLAIGPNGLRVIRSLSPDLYSEICAQGQEQRTFELKSANGWNLGGFAAESPDDEHLASIVIARQRLWSCIRAHVPDSAIVYTAITGATFPTEDSDNSVAQLDLASEDEDNATADLVIAADGVHSPLRGAITNKNSISKSNAAKYVGLVGIGGLLPKDISLPVPPSSTSMVLTFGRNGFFGYGTTSAHEAGWWSTYSLSTPPESNKSIDTDDIKRQLRERHAQWHDPNIQTFIQHVEISSIYPTWVVDLKDVPRWSRGNVVLVGDAAHAMQPSSGQGVSQALEDACVLALFLAHCVSSTASQQETSAEQGQEQQDDARQRSIRHAFELYERLRRPRVTKVVEQGNRGGDKKRTMSRPQEMLMYGAVWALTHWPWGQGWQKDLYSYRPDEEVEKFIGKTKQEERKKTSKGGA